MQNFDLWKAQIPEIVGSFERLIDIYEGYEKFPESSEIYEIRLATYYNDYLNFTGLNEHDISLYEWIEQVKGLI